MQGSPTLTLRRMKTTRSADPYAGAGYSGMSGRVDGETVRLFSRTRASEGSEMKKRIESNTSRTAQLTCLSRACSAMETNPYYKSDDDVALLLLPGVLKAAIRFSPARKLFARVFAPKGIYEYVIARTKYIDAAFKQALSEQFDQILIFGAGFDTRALRFQESISGTTIFELDVPFTQQAKINQYHTRQLSIPGNVTFIPIDFDRESLSEHLDNAGVRRGVKSLFILEGVIMYLHPESVDLAFRTIRKYGGTGSRIVFDAVYASVLRKEGKEYGEKGIVKTVTDAGEQWIFGIEKGCVNRFLGRYEMRLVDKKDTEEIEHEYFCTPDGTITGRINGTHFLVTAEYGPAAVSGKEVPDVMK